MTNGEIWKDIKGYEGIYQVSNRGRVRSLTRKVYNYMKSGRILKTHDNGHSYLNVGLSDGKKVQKHAYIHRLVAEAFLEKPEGCTEVNHKDFDKTNNCVENLEWVTDLQNKRHYRASKFYHAVAERRQKTVSGKTMKKIVKYKDDILNLYEQGYSIKEVADKLGVARDFTRDVLVIFGVEMN